jgi:hypothetical protein
MDDRHFDYINKIPPKTKNTAVQSTYTYSNPVCRSLATSFPYTSTCVTYCATKGCQVSIVFCVFMCD